MNIMDKRHRPLAALASLLLMSTVPSNAATTSGGHDAWSQLAPWLPGIIEGFGFDILISFLAMFIGTILGFGLGIGQLSPKKSVRLASRYLSQFFRNAPWLVILFFCVYLLPYEIHVFSYTVQLPGWVKGVFGLSFPVMGNVSEVVRGGIQSLPSGQWEAASSLGLNRKQTMRLCIIPQALRRMAAPWMNTYAILMMSTPLVSIVGVEDSVTFAGSALAALANPALMMPVYGLILALFFAYCAPIAVLTKRLERRFR
jgi:polar amino acid transport system permease protein